MQDRGLGRAAFDAVIPEVFPLDSIIFLPNGHEDGLHFICTIPSLSCSAAHGRTHISAKGDLQVG